MDRPRWRTWLLVAPWLVALGIGLVASLPTGSTAGPAAAPAPSVGAPSVDGAATDDRATSDGEGPTTRPVEGDDPAEVPLPVRLDPATTARVLAAARAALGSHGLSASSPADPGARDRWVLDQVVSDPIPSGEGAVLVVVHATVITRGEAGWTGPTLAAAAVPVVLGPPVEVGSVEVLGPPRTVSGTGADGADVGGDARVTTPAPDPPTTDGPTTTAGPPTTTEDQ